MKNDIDENISPNLYKNRCATAVKINLNRTKLLSIVPRKIGLAVKWRTESKRRTVRLLLACQVHKHVGGQLQMPPQMYTLQMSQPAPITRVIVIEIIYLYVTGSVVLTCV